jgi:hypothetical protein
MLTAKFGFFVLRPQVIENDLDPNQALILANQNQPKAIKPYDLSRALAPLIDIEARKLASVHQKIDEDGTANESARNSARNIAKLAGFLAVSTIASGSLAFTTLCVNF